MSEIVFNDVTKVYKDGTEAVRDLSLEVPDGNLMVFVGPSGCGKTTALRMVAGLEEITEGEIRIGDRVINDVQPKDRDIAMIFQNYALYPHMTVYENMAFGLKLRKLKKGEIDRRVKETAAVIGLGDLLKRKPGQLSGGQRQRVAMGRAIVREPRAFLMDEPLSNLDAKLRVQMRSEILRIQRTVGVTTIYVTHDQIEAMTMGDRVAVMRMGDLQQVDSPQELYSRPVNLFVAAFIGSPAMNLALADLIREDGTLRVSFGGLSLPIDESVLAQRPALRAYEGKKVIIGIRPEHMEDASMVSDAPADRRISVPVDLTESMGSEVYVHFSVDVPPVVTEDTKELAADRGDVVAVEELETLAAERRSSFVGRFNARTKAREGETIEVVVDTPGIHFFDPDTAAGIYGER
jgi:multiple sugar transport system ATP-binding protein